jgi:hypothetical protein
LEAGIPKLSSGNQGTLHCQVLISSTFYEQLLYENASLFEALMCSLFRLVIFLQKEIGVKAVPYKMMLKLNTV